MGGPAAPKDWQGGLPITYRFGDKAKVHMKVDMDTRVMPYYNVEGRIRGSQNPEQFVVLGNHHDAWEFGGVDPSSGTASMMEMTRAFGQLSKDGIRPKRTLVFCSWDGEEVGLTGSTEWGEQFEDQLKKNAIAYLNVDSSAAGPEFDGSAVGSLAPMLSEVTKSFTDPATGTSLHDAWLSTETKKRKEANERDPVTEANLVDVRIGSGSDHTVFLNHDGVPVIGLQFDGPYGVYHSMYDDFYWMNHFGDPGYKYHTLMSQMWGTVALRLANADRLPFDFQTYATKIREFVLEVQSKPSVKKKVDFQPLLNAVAQLEREASTLNASLKSSDIADVDSLNRAFIAFERNWLLDNGIPGRPWFKHALYAARYTYAHLELPGLTEAVENGDWTTAKQQAKLLESAIAKNTTLLVSLNEALRPKTDKASNMH
jgi:N-acetylated-alpha-linked acidic dipeptidase